MEVNSKMQQSYKQQRIQTKDKKTNDLKENPGHSNMPTPSKKYVVISDLCNQKKMVSNLLQQDHKNTSQQYKFVFTTPLLHRKVVNPNTFFSIYTNDDQYLTNIPFIEKDMEIARKGISPISSPGPDEWPV